MYPIDPKPPNPNPLNSEEEELSAPRKYLPLSDEHGAYSERLGIDPDTGKLEVAEFRDEELAAYISLVSEFIKSTQQPETNDIRESIEDLEARVQDEFPEEYRSIFHHRANFNPGDGIIDEEEDKGEDDAVLVTSGENLVGKHIYFVGDFLTSIKDLRDIMNGAEVEPYSFEAVKSVLDERFRDHKDIIELLYKTRVLEEPFQNYSVHKEDLIEVLSAYKTLQEGTRRRNAANSMIFYEQEAYRQCADDFVNPRLKLYLLQSALSNDEKAFTGIEEEIAEFAGQQRGLIEILRNSGYYNQIVNSELLSRQFIAKNERTFPFLVSDYSPDFPDITVVAEYLSGIYDRVRELIDDPYDRVAFFALFEPCDIDGMEVALDYYQSKKEGNNDVSSLFGGVS